MKHHKKKLILALLMVTIIVQSSICLMASAAAQNTNSLDIVQIAQGNKDLSTLVTALESAGLVDALKGDGPFTVFAPTNEAFNKLPAGTLDNLLKPQNKNALANLLYYHVTSGRVSSSELSRLNGKEINMLSGQPAGIEVRNGSIYIDGAKVTIADIQAKNGVIHVIDAVMQP